MTDIKQKAEEYAKSDNITHDVGNERCVATRAFIAGYKLAQKWNSPDEKPDLELTINDEVLAQSENRIYFGMYIRNKWHTFYEGKWRETEIDGWIYLPPINQ